MPNHQSCHSILQGPYNEVEYTPKDDGFFDILGSSEGSSTVRMLLSHELHMRFRSVERLVVVGKPKFALVPESRSLIILTTGQRPRMIKEETIPSAQPKLFPQILILVSNLYSLLCPSAPARPKKNQIRGVSKGNSADCKRAPFLFLHSYSYPKNFQPGTI